MTASIDRRAFLKRAGAATVALSTAPLAAHRAAAASDRLVVAVGQWGTETPFAWRSVQAEKPLWDCVYDPLIVRDPKTFEYRPGLATEWKASNEMRTWTFKLRSGVKFHDGWGELTAEDVRWTVEQSFKPDALGGSAYYFRNNLERIETPDKLTVVMHFKSRQWIVPSLFTQYVGYQNVTSRKYMETVGDQKAAMHPIGTGPYRHVEGKQGDFHRLEAVPGHWRKTPGFRELGIRRIPEPATRLAGLPLNLAVDKKAIMKGLWKGRGSEIPYSYYYYPFNRGYSSDWKLPPYDPERAKKLLAEAGHGGGFDVRVNPYVQLVAQDGPDVMEAVALDWEKVGLKVKRVPEATSSFGPKMRLRKSNKPFSVYGSPPYDEPVAGWERVIHSKAAFNLLLDGTYDEDIDVAMRELDPDKRARLTHDLGQKLYDGYHGVMLGLKSITWAVTRKVGAWTTLAYVPAETNYESVTPAGLRRRSAAQRRPH